MTPPAMTVALRRWDIFCKVVDNFGDAGVSWRLARQLVAEHGLDVTLWIDRPAALACIAPGVSPDTDVQCACGVTVRRWGEPPAAADPADVVIEAFGCGLPAPYLAAMAARATPPPWFVLEYLSAEPWVDATHGLPSRHPRLRLDRRFWFPGFTAGTAGLLRERDLFRKRDAYRADARAQGTLWTSLGIRDPASADLRVSLFCYPNDALPGLLDAWADGDLAIVCALPEGTAAGALDTWTGGSVPHAGGPPLVRGRLRLHAIPFVSQDEYDRLLWACDINFVRGEDSIVRAQWAAQPFAWHIYPQAEAAHLGKLKAFLDRYSATLDPAAARAVRQFMGAWNADPDAGAIGSAWLEFAAARPNLLRHGAEWATGLASLPDLAGGLVKTAADKV
jgi:uncharacterized repeat protein (TIGR03837 family)